MLLLSYMYTIYSRVEWFTICFRFSKTDPLLSIRCIFMSSIPTKSANFAARLRQRFNFQKITGTLKMNINIFFFKYLSFTSLNTHEKENSKLKSVKTFYFRPPKWAKWFLTWTKKKSKLFWVSLNFLLSNKLRNSFCFRCNL